jgi:hypothetical protein
MIVALDDHYTVIFIVLVKNYSYYLCGRIFGGASNGAHLIGKILSFLNDSQERAVQWSYFDAQRDHN